MNLIKKEYLSNAERIINSVTLKGSTDTLGITRHRFNTKRFKYEFKIIEGHYVTPFLMVTVGNGRGSISEMITHEYLCLRSIFKVVRELKNEI